MGKKDKQGNWIVPTFIANCECEELGVQMYIDTYAKDEKLARKEAKNIISKLTASRFKIALH